MIWAKRRVRVREAHDSRVILLFDPGPSVPIFLSVLPSWRVLCSLSIGTRCSGEIPAQPKLDRCFIEPGLREEELMPRLEFG